MHPRAMSAAAAEQMTNQLAAPMLASAAAPARSSAAVPSPLHLQAASHQPPPQQGSGGSPYAALPAPSSFSPPAASASLQRPLLLRPASLPHTAPYQHPNSSSNSSSSSSSSHHRAATHLRANTNMDGASQQHPHSHQHHSQPHQSQYSLHHPPLSLSLQQPAQPYQQRTSDPNTPVRSHSISGPASSSSVDTNGFLHQTASGSRSARASHGGMAMMRRATAGELFFAPPQRTPPHQNNGPAAAGSPAGGAVQFHNALQQHQYLLSLQNSGAAPSGSQSHGNGSSSHSSHLLLTPSPGSLQHQAHLQRERDWERERERERSGGPAASPTADGRERPTTQGVNYRRASTRHMLQLQQHLLSLIHI